MTDTERYLQQARTFAAQAEMAGHEEERAAFLRMAGAYVQLAADAATFERTWGVSLGDEAVSYAA